MRSNYKILVFLLSLSFTLVMCKSGGGEGPDPDHKLSVNISPSAEAGTVSPSGGTYKAGDNVSIEANPSSGWQFKSWSGDKSSSINPLEFTITKDINIIANFTEGPGPDEFESEMTVSNGSISRPINFGLLDQNGVQEGFDDNDFESPPIAPSGSFFTGFIHGGMNLYQDYRPPSEEATWRLRLNRDANSNMDLSWSFSNNIDKGELKLVSNPNVSNPSLEIDMLAQSSYSVTDPSIQSLFIVYTVSQAKSIITGVDNSGNAGDVKVNTNNQSGDAADVKKAKERATKRFEGDKDF